MRSSIIGLSMLLLWSSGLFASYTIIGFIEMLLLIVFLNFLLNKILKMDPNQTTQEKITSTKIVADESI